jgi:3-deoxy-7-phosphoheptulonate synthase
LIIAGPCLYIDENFKEEVWQTALRLKDKVDFFRCKIWGGGTKPEKYFPGVGNKGLELLSYINTNVMPVMTEVQTPDHVTACRNKIDSIWVGARNSQNYALLENCSTWNGYLFVKRGFGMTMDELIGVYDIMQKKFSKDIYVVERGINTFDRTPEQRWSIDFRGVLMLKRTRPDIFKQLVVDVSHSSGHYKYIEDIYFIFKNLGVKHFMFEVYNDVTKAVTDKLQAIGIETFSKILER